jgi:periplasmic divalent cation tolerance protein
MLVMTTCASAEAADKLAAALVGGRQAACVNRISNVSSTYRWQGAVHTDQEALLLIKTTEARLAAVQATILAQPEYELPEYIVVRIDSGAPAYLTWLAEAVAD